MGTSFASAQIIIDLLSLAIVILIYLVADRILPRMAAFSAAALALLLSDSGFQLFSLQIYTPAMLTGAVGILLMTLGLVDMEMRQANRGWAQFLVLCGSVIAIFGKQDYLPGVVAAAAGVIWLAITNKRAGTDTSRSAYTMTLAPIMGLFIGLSALAVTALVLGPAMTLPALGGYGLAKITCPWWPTGLGLFGGIASIFQAAIIAAALSLFWCKSLLQRYGRIYLLCLLAVALSSLVYIAYVVMFVTLSEAARSYYQNAQLLSGRFGFIGNGIAATSYLLTKRNVFLPVTWACIGGIVAASFWLLFPRNSLPPKAACLYLLGIVTCGLTARQMFGDYAEAYPNVTIASYPLLFILTAAILFYLPQWLASHAKQDKEQASTAGYIALSAFLLLYGGSRLAISTASELRSHYQWVKTRAGAVRLNDQDAINLYSYVEKEIKPGDQIVDIGANVGGSFYGGGINFAAKAGSPLYSVVFTDVMPPDYILRKDLDALVSHPPRFVVGTSPPQALYGLADAWNRCSFPAIVWAPHLSNFDLNKKIPVIDEIKRRYEPVYRSGRWVIFALKPNK